MINVRGVVYSSQHCRSEQAAPLSRWSTDVRPTGSVALAARVVLQPFARIMSDTTTPSYVDKCAQCETYVLTDSLADLARRMNAHELTCHGRVQPTRSDHRKQSYR